MAELFPLAKTETADHYDCVELSKAPSRTLDTVFLNAGQAKKKAGKEAEAQLLDLLSQALSMYYRPGKPAEPFGPKAVFSSGRTAIVTDFTDQNLDVFAAVLKQKVSAPLKARLNDVLWLRRKAVANAEGAIEAYIEQAMTETDASENWLPGKEGLQRACELWQTIGRPEKFAGPIKAAADKVAALGGAEPDDFRRVQAVRLMTEYGLYANEKTFKEQVLRFAEETKAAKHHDKSRAYLESALELAKPQKDKEATKAIQKQEMDSYVSEAREFKAAGANGLLLSHKYSEAIEACRRFGGQKALVEELQREMQAVQADMVKEMKEVKVEFDASDLVASGKKAVEGGTLENAVHALAAMAVPPPKDELRKELVGKSAEFPFQSLISSTVVDEKGRVVGRKSPILSSDPKEREAGILGEMVSHVALHQSTACIQIEAARRALLQRCPHGVAPFDSLIRMNPFVPPARVGIFRKGLEAGLEGNWLECAHLLIPQLENSIRSVLEKSGLLVTALRDDQVQMERDLNFLLYEKAADEVFGADLVFSLRVLLVEKTGKNLRNKLAHGLLAERYFAYDPMAFIWATTVRLCLIGKSWVEAAEAEAAAKAEPPPEKK